jgi:hypothetical protein
MLHVMFEYYSCRCKHSCEEKRYQLFESTHNLNWQAAGQAIELADRKLLGLNLCLGRNTSMGYDIFRGAPLHNSIGLRRVGT